MKKLKEKERRHGENPVQRTADDSDDHDDEYLIPDERK